MLDKGGKGKPVDQRMTRWKLATKIVATGGILFGT